MAQRAEKCRRTVSRSDLVERDEIFFLKGDSAIQNGFVCTYHEGGSLKTEIPYKDGKREGNGKRYYESGSLNIETPYKNGKVEGISKEYSENGKLKSETPYKNGEIDGQAKQY